MNKFVILDFTTSWTMFAKKSENLNLTYESQVFNLNSTTAY